ncbi:glycosyltransferase family 2 protein [Brucella pituitosa]|uniref:Glycosyltransferase family 2 protein n=1 Tax=Brucella pituitosa TaxID=571256 RepID=A0ABS3K1W3_9HYPH|nr:glycosyltransferase family 2 protein [Brucella pituitosa]MBO1040397.1 glycosyltransferase family 2 protein [Brucella pituitosa]
MLNRIYRSNYNLQFDHRSRASNDDTITVAVSLYNYEREVLDCLESIKTQTYPNLSLMIVDDCSQKDNSLERAVLWSEHNSERFVRTTVVRHEFNQGLAQARNTAFAVSDTRALFIMDADNMIYPRAIEVLAPCVLNEGYAAAYTQLEFFGDVSGLGYADYWSPDFFRENNYVDAMALISRSAWQTVRGYTHMEGGWEDYDFWCKFVDSGLDAIFIPQILCRYRVHGTSMLRTDTVNNQNDLIVEMRMRHPWLTIGS